MRGRYYIGIVGLFVACAAIVAAAFPGHTMLVLHGAHLVPVQEEYTELYFSEYEDLASASAVGRVIAFSFTIRSHEATSVEYPYVVYVIDRTGSKAVVDRGMVTLSPGEQFAVANSLRVTPALANATLYVELLSRNQSLHYKIART